ncbi:NifU family protein [Rhodospirillum sp. A1_3_36]|uniref:NifU family protein n=1 Tax=Rhodospirillum sp. A1_3_36 TaxID=3391666 RepID=UPI0039A6CBD7
MSQEAFEAKVHEVIESTIRPRLQKDNGDISVVRIEENKVFVDMTGACVGCQLASVTLMGVQQKIMEAVGKPVRIIPAHAADHQLAGKSKSADHQLAGKTKPVRASSIGASAVPA